MQVFFEVARLYADNWGTQEKMIESIKPNEYGWLFPPARAFEFTSAGGANYFFLFDAFAN
jgi:hypothetical protein